MKEYLRTLVREHPYAIPFAIAMAIVILFHVVLANATWKPEYAQLPKEVQDWYRNAELTEAAQARLHIKYCCAKADVVKTKFRVNRTSGADEWEWLDNGEWKVVPPDIIHVGESAPSGEPTLFVWSGKPTCFFPGRGGI